MINEDFFKHMMKGQLSWVLVPISLYIIFLLSYIFHLALLYPLINIQEYLQINYINYLLGIFALIIINFLPYWPYLVSRVSMTYICIIIYFILTVISFLYTSNNNLLIKKLKI
jgi:hypothetical protein